MMFHPSGTICAQNVRFYIEATIIVHILSICCFPPFSQLSAFAYIYFYLTCSFLLACRLSPKWDHLCPRYLEMIFFFTRMRPSVPRYLELIFFTRMGPSVPKIFRDDFFHVNGIICARDT